MKTLAIVVGLIETAGGVLMLQRSSEKRYAPGKWEPVGGFLDFRQSAEAAVLRWASHRAGIETTIAVAGAAFECEDAGAWWIVKPFLLRPSHGSPSVRLSGDHVASRWVTPSDALRLDCVDGVREDLEAVGLVTSELSTPKHSTVPPAPNRYALLASASG